MAENQVPGENKPEQQTQAPTGSAPNTSTGMEQNVAGLLCYVLTWVTGIVFLLLEKENRFVRFHAIQAIGVGIVWTVAWIFLSIMAGVLPGALGTLILILAWLALGAGGLIVWIMLMIKAYQGQMWKLPVIGDIAEREAAKI